MDILRPRWQNWSAGRRRNGNPGLLTSLLAKNSALFSDVRFAISEYEGTTDENVKGLLAAGVCGVNDETKELKKCGKCTKIRYCSNSCQQSDWGRHKPECRAIVEARKLKKLRRHHQSRCCGG